MHNSFRAILKQLRIKALTELISILIPDLEAEGFSFPDLLLALAEWSENSPTWRNAAYYLEQAANPPDRSQTEGQSD
ncbi:MAG: hypothetical protein RMY28_009305 [Nostoc sp. ChiSLP01]